MADSKPVNELPRMVPDRDEIRTRKGAATETATAKTPPKAPAPAARRTSGGPMVWVALLVLLVVVAGLGLMAYSQNQMLSSYEERLQLADERITSLERSMNETGESVAMNETAINAQFRAIKSETDMQMSEIRKLWDVANKRNREWIEENQQAIGQLQASLQSQTEQITAINTKLDEQSKALQTQQSAASERAAALEEVRTNLAGLSEDLAAIDLKSLEERLISLTLAQETLQLDQGEIQTTQQALNETVTDLNETIQAIDASRLDTNRRLVTLSDRLQALEAKVSASPAQ